MPITPNSRKKTNNRKGKANKNSGPIGGPTAAAIPQIPPSNHDPDNSKQKGKWTNDPAMFGVTVVLAICAAVTIGVLCLQARILKQTDETSRATDRAFIDFGNTVLISYPQEKPVTFAIVTNVINSGNTPARTVKLAFSCPARDSSKRNIDPYDLEPLKPQFQPPTFFGPKQSIDLIVCELPLTLFSDIKSGIERFVVIEAKYADAFDPGEIRTTQMTRFITADEYGRHRLGYSGRHNCSDNDCPK